MRFCISLLLLLTGGFLARSQVSEITGKVLLFNPNGKASVASQADVYWADGSGGTQTNEFGVFRILRSNTSVKLVIAYVGFRSDTLDISDLGQFELTLMPDNTLNEVVVSKRVRSTEISFLESIKIEKIGEAELQKAACCNLAESFETQPGVDVAITDALTGTRQIRMLGLSGIYNQITIENMPGLRGLAAVKGLEYIPGTWIESMQLNKGTGSVANGYESATGQINLELRKPDKSDKLYLNLFANQGGRLETNIHLRKSLNEKLSTGLLLHAKYNQMENDRNNDGFLDMPLSRHLIGMHRWKYFSDYVRWQMMVYGSWIETTAGQIGVPAFANQRTQGLWGLQEDFRQLSFYGKMGIVDRKNSNRSTAIQLKADWIDQRSVIGLKNYHPIGKTAYANLIHQNNRLDKFNSFRTGTSVQLDDMTEKFNDTSYSRTEIVPGAFGELTTKIGTRFSSVIGLRIDHSNYYNWFATPRLHLRYALKEDLVLRFSGGRGQRTPLIFSDNPRIWASNRQFRIHSTDNGKPYGLEPEVAWNYGLSLTGEFTLDYREGLISFDLYRTDFTDQIVIDFDENPGEVHIYALNGKSYSTSFQAQVDYEVLKRFDLRLAYRWYDVRTRQISGLRSAPYMSRNRAFLNLAHETRKKWKFDATVNWFDGQRLPETSGNPMEYRMPASSPAYFTWNGQITKTWKKGLESYVGFENLLDYRQEQVIISADTPFGEYFDASMVWGPVFGRNIYVGLRYRIE